MVARDPIRNIVLDPRPKVSRDKNGNLVAEGNPHIGSTRSTDVADRPEQTEDVSGYSSSEVARDNKLPKDGKELVFHTADESTETVDTAPAADDSKSSKKG